MVPRQIMVFVFRLCLLGIILVLPNLLIIYIIYEDKIVMMDDMKASCNDGWYHDRLLVDQLRIWQNGINVGVG